MVNFLMFYKTKSNLLHFILLNVSAYTPASVQYTSQSHDSGSDINFHLNISYPTYLTT